MKRMIDTHGAHRRLEGWPLVFTVLTTLAILVGTAIEFVPAFLLTDAVPEISTVKPFTPLEVAGRDLYIREGCNNCHSQMVRPFRDEIERYGDFTKAAETAYEHPHLWGSKRTGPDLQRLGGKYPHLWHVRHMEDPRSTSPNSIMPPYAWMLRRPADLDDLPARLRALRAVGVPYSDDEIENAPTLARQQAEAIAAEVEQQGGPARLADKEIIALVAFLQRLGTDLQGTPAEEDLEPHEIQENLETTGPVSEVRLLHQSPSDRP